jgi:tRNA-dihydrouridine synthase A
MMDRTDRHFRFFMRALARHCWLYTEMIPVGALLHGDAERHLRFDAAEHPVALQLGGSDPEQLALAAALGADAGYDEINLNVGCPSERVQHACWGAALMLEAGRVAECVAAMRERVTIPVTVKTRLGVDDHDSYEFLKSFVDTVARVGCETFILHARKAWLSGLSPRQNRDVPPLDYGNYECICSRESSGESRRRDAWTGCVASADADRRARCPLLRFEACVTAVGSGSVFTIY